MKTSRRKFLHTAGVMAGTSALLPTGIAYAEKTLEEMALWDWDTSGNSDEFWEQISLQYNSSPHMINLNNGGVSPQPKPVREALQRYTEYCNEAPAYTMWRVMEPGRENVRTRLATLLGCDREEVAINRNTTEALHTLIRGIPLKKGDEVVLSRYDYPRMINAWKYREKTEGIVLKWVDFNLPLESEDEIIRKYTEQFTSRTKLLHLTHMINWTGQMIPAKEITDQAHQKGIRVLLDAAHTFAHIDFSIANIGADYMGTSLHKWLCAPFGTGLLYIKQDLIGEIPTIFIEDPDNPPKGIRKFEELGTRNVPAELAIGDAINFHEMIGIQRKQERLFQLTSYWSNALKDHDRIRLRHSLNPNFTCGIGLLEIDGMAPNDIEFHLRENYRINTVSIIIKNLNGIRIAPHIYTRLQELDIFIDGIRGILKK